MKTLYWWALVFVSFLFLIFLQPVAAQEQYRKVDNWFSPCPNLENKNYFPSTRIYSVATDSSGNVYALTPSHVQKYDPDGHCLLQWGGSGTNPGQFRGLYMNQIAIDSGDIIYIMDTGNARIQKFTPDGKPAGIIDLPQCNCTPYVDCTAQGDQPNECKSITLDSQGNIYVGNTHRMHLYKLSPEGIEVPSWGSPGNSGTTKAFVLPDGNLITAGYYYQIVDPDGHFISGLDLPETGGISAVDKMGNIYRQDQRNHTIWKINKDMQVTATLSGWASSIAVDSDGNLYFSTVLEILKYVPVGTENRSDVSQTVPAPSLPVTEVTKQPLTASPTRVPVSPAVTLFGLCVVLFAIHRRNPRR